MDAVKKMKRIGKTNMSTIATSSVITFKGIPLKLVEVPEYDCGRCYLYYTGHTAEDCIEINKTIRCFDNESMSVFVKDNLGE